ncbi:MAG: 30S ribosome-binding factor RbfA [Alphaproteobacteria bacterium]|jgi:ribosome-binding factor A|nr:30S ribosome-binding factor RbfA [Alphaproteobacteria bacterium]
MASYRDTHGDDRERTVRSGGGARGPSQRQLRAGELIRHAVAEVLTREEIHHEDLIGVTITVTEVALSPDLRQATCYIMPLGGKNTDKILQALKDTGGWIGGQVAKRVSLKYAPRLHFRVDGSFDNAAHVQGLLKRSDVAPDLVSDQNTDPSGDASKDDGDESDDA